MLHLIKNSLWKMTSLLVAAAVVCAAFANASPAYAAAPTATLFNPALQKWFQNEKDWLAVQQTNLDKTTGRIDKVQALISKAQGKGKDVSDLQTALALYQSQIATAQSAHDTAAAILAAHNGFDGSGKVIDRDAARLTVNSARQSLNDAHRILWQAARDLFHAINQWRKAN